MLRHRKVRAIFRRGEERGAPNGRNPFQCRVTKPRRKRAAPIKEKGPRFREGPLLIETVFGLDLDLGVEVDAKRQSLEGRLVWRIDVRLDDSSRVEGVTDISRSAAADDAVSAGIGNGPRDLRAAEAAADDVRKVRYQRNLRTDVIANLHVQLKLRRRDEGADAVERTGVWVGDATGTDRAAVEGVERRTADAILVPETRRAVARGTGGRGGESGSTGIRSDTDRARRRAVALTGEHLHDPCDRPLTNPLVENNRGDDRPPTPLDRAAQALRQEVEGCEVAVDRKQSLNGSVPVRVGDGRIGDGPAKLVASWIRRANCAGTAGTQVTRSRAGAPDGRTAAKR